MVSTRQRETLTCGHRPNAHLALKLNKTLGSCTKRDNQFQTNQDHHLGKWYGSFVRKRTLVKYQSQSEVIKAILYVSQL